MLKVTPLCQRNPNWKNKKLGFSSLSIGSYGCTLTSLTMLINYLGNKKLCPDEVNDKLKAVNAFSGALLVWYRVPLAFPELKFISRLYNYNNFKAAEYTYLRKLPVMVEVNAARIGASKHWCLMLGDKKMVDPWTGEIVPTNYYPLTGLSLYQKR